MPLSAILQSITIILSPLYIIRSQMDVSFLGNLFGINLVPFTFLEVLLILTFLVTSFDFIKKGRDLKLVRTKYDLLIGLFLISAVFAVFASFNFIGSLGILKAYFIEPVIFYYCLIYTSRIYGSKYIYSSLILSGIWLSILGLIQNITGAYSLAPHEIIQGRISGIYNSANAHALFLAPISLLALGFFLQVKSKAQKPLYLSIYLFLFLNILWTKSRGGLGGEIIGTLTILYGFLVLRNRFLKKIWYIIPSFFITVFLVILINFYNTHNFFPVDFSKPYALGDTLQIRYFIWAGTINMLKDHPLTGAGLDGFRTLYTNQYRLSIFQEEFQYPHNLILTIWSELGIFGLFSFILIFVSSATLLLRRISVSKQPFIGLSLLSILAYWLFHGLVDVPYFKNDLSLQFWIIIAMLQLYSERKDHGVLE